MATSFSDAFVSPLGSMSPDVLLAVESAFPVVGGLGVNASRAKFRVPLAGGFLLFSDSLPARVLPVVEKIAGFSSLAPNWDSYGALSINPLCIAASVQLALQLIGPDTPIPFASPMVHGGVQLEWHCQGGDFEIYVESPSKISAFYSDDNTGEEVSFDISNHTDQLKKYLDRMKQI